MNAAVVILGLSSVWAVVVGSNSYVYSFKDKGKSDGSPEMEGIQTCKMLSDWLL